MFGRDRRARLRSGDYALPRSSRGADRPRSPTRGAPSHATYFSRRPRRPRRRRSPAPAAGTSVAATASAVGDQSPAAQRHLRRPPPWPRTPRRPQTGGLPSSSPPGSTTTRFGTAFSGAVLDAGSNATVWRKNGDTAYKPASTNKLVTASNALTAVRPRHALHDPSCAAGRTADQVILQGVGRPQPHQCRPRRHGGHDGDARCAPARSPRPGSTSTTTSSPTPTLAYGWKVELRPRLDRAGARPGPRPARRARTPAPRRPATSGTGSRPTAWPRRSTTGAPTPPRPPRCSRAGQAPRRLDDGQPDAAQQRQRDRRGAAQAGQPSSSGTAPRWTGARTAQAKQLAAQGLKATALYDGSGLSRADRLSALQLTRIVDRGLDSRVRRPALAAAVRAGDADRGPHRHPHVPLHDHRVEVRRRQGVGQDRHARATWSRSPGFTKGTDGRVKVFAFVVNGKSSTTTLKQNIDMLAATVNGCY